MPDQHIAHSCLQCQGKGTIPCPRCHGEGHVALNMAGIDTTSSCDHCYGSGKIKCTTCDGTGTVKE